MSALLLSSPVLAATLTVGAAGADHTTIQAAVSAASAGDRIEVAPGSYVGPVDFGGKDVAIVGTGGAVATTLTGGGGAYALYAASGETAAASLEGFTLRAAIYVEASSPVLRDLVLEDLGGAASYGGAAYVASGSPSFDGVTFRDNTAAQGAHVYVAGGSPTFAACDFTGGQSEYGAVMVYNADASFDSSTFTGNIAAYGGGAIGAYQFARVTAVDTDFTDNRSGGNGGAVWLSTVSSLTASGGTFLENFTEQFEVYYGGGVYVDSGSSAALDGVGFEQNYANYGGAVATEGGDVSLVGVRFDENRANSSGGAVSAWGDASVSDDGGVWKDNYANSSGGALAQYSGTLSLLGSELDASQSYYGYGGAAYVEATALTASGLTVSESSSYYGGGAFYLYNLTAPARFESSTFEDNAATYGSGGAIYGYYFGDIELVDSTLEGNSGGYAGGAVTAEYYSALTVDGSTFRGNIAGESGSSGVGGAIYFIPYNGQNDTLWLRTSVFEDNIARGEGGALIAWYADAVNVFDSRFVNNEASPELGGGAIILKTVGRVTVQRNLLANNRAAYGGGAYVEVATSPRATHTWTNNVFQENRARYGGGLCFVDMGNPGELSLHNNDLLGNVASEGGGGLCLYNAAVDFRNNVVAYQVEGAALAAYDEASVEGSRFAFNNLYDNLDGNGEGLSPADLTSTLDMSPRFAGYTRDGDPDNDALTLAASSALIDAGDPGILDPDGGPSDVGASGGPNAPMEDADADGWVAREDCDDDDPEAHPGAAEIWYDGRNQDCEPGSDYDADLDGHDSADYGGDDCDDRDGTLWDDCPDTDTPDDTGATSADDTGTGPTDDTAAADVDTGEGAQDRPPLDDEPDAKSCGCATSTSPPATPWLLLLGFIGLRRRQLSSPGIADTPGR